jgi:hypothetical protein
MFGRLELVLINWEGRQMGEQTMRYWRRRCCPELARAFSEGRHPVAREALGVHTTAGITTEITKLQWTFDKRKTKPGTKNMSLQELMRNILGALKNAMEGRIIEDKWDVEATEFGRDMEAMGRMIEACVIEVDIADFPRFRAQLEHEPGQE